MTQKMAAHGKQANMLWGGRFTGKRGMRIPMNTFWHTALLGCIARVVIHVENSFVNISRLQVVSTL